MADVQAGVLYVDTSALVKLVIREAETDALEEELGRWNDLATSVITSIELSHAVARARSHSTAVVADQYTILGVLASLAEGPLDDDVRAVASTLTPVELRTLDAIHLASATTWLACSPTTTACSELPSPAASPCSLLSPHQPKPTISRKRPTDRLA